MQKAMIYPHAISCVWPQVSELLKPALDAEGTHTIDDVKKTLLNGSTQLWVIFTDKIEAALVTEIITYPRKTRLRIWLAGALKGNKTNWHTLYDIVVKFAIDNMCDEIESIGRKGWSRIFPQLKETRTILRCKLGG